MVEVLVGTVATMIITAIVGLLLLMPYQTMGANQEYAKIRRDISYALKVMARDIHASSISDIVVSSGSLTLPDSAGAGTERYELTGDVLRSSNEILIDEGVQRFDLVATNDLQGLRGVFLDIEIQNSTGDITLRHDTYIHTRN